MLYKWQQNDWPKFTYDLSPVETGLYQFVEKQGHLREAGNGFALCIRDQTNYPIFRFLFTPIFQMMPIRLLSLFVVLMIFGHCGAQSTSSATSATEDYTFETASRDGTGKYYLEREIAQVMGHLAAGWLERPEREKQENVSTAIQNMQLKGDEYIADIGAGSGYYTFRLAEQVPKGKVFAVDIQPEMLEIMRQKIKTEHIGNVELIQSQEKSPNLAENSVDMVLMVDVYHELSYPKELMQQVVKALKPGGRFVLLEYRMEDPEVPIKLLHKMSLAQAVQEMQAVGLQLQENIGNLPWQHFMVFGKE